MQKMEEAQTDKMKKQKQNTMEKNPYLVCSSEISVNLISI